MTIARTADRLLTETLGEALDRAAEDPTAGIRLLDRREADQWISWSDILAGAERIGSGLIAAGLEPGDRVGLIFPTGAELLEALFGTLVAGGVPAFLPPAPRLGRLEGFSERTHAMLEAIEARLLFTDGRSNRRIGKTVPPRPLGTLTLEDLSATASSWPDPPPPDAMAVIQFSSGTTIAPKPVALSHESVLEQARLLNSFWPDTVEVRQRGLSWLPLYHDMGLIGCLFAALVRPGELTLMPPEVFAARPAIWLRAISRFGITVSPATNFAYAYCAEQIRDEELEGVDLSRWQVALNGAEPVSADVMRGFSRRFSRWGFKAESLTPVYGLAEASLAVTFSPVRETFVSRRFARSSLAVGRRVADDPGGLELVSVGRPVPGFEISIRDPERGELPDATVGRIWTRGPTLMNGYLGCEAATRETLVEGWLDTGDLGFVHRSELYICGRVKDVIIVRGRNHSPVEIEQAAESVPGVRMGGAAAVGHLPEAGDRERVVVFVERSRRAPEAGLADSCRQAVLGRAGVEVDDVVVLAPDTIPRTSSGKVRRSETLRRYLEGELGSS